MDAKVERNTSKPSGKTKKGVATAAVEVEEVQAESPEEQMKAQTLWKKKRRAYWNLQFAKMLDTPPPAKAAK